jgi:two-component system chemotaxis family response regulator WspR
MTEFMGMSGLPSMTAQLPEQPNIMVLLVDDQVMVGEAIRRALADQVDFNYHFCSNAVDALTVAHSIKPTVILQDLVMPEVDGLDLVRSYRATPATRDVPIIVLSTKEEAVVKREAFAAGANDYLVKLPEAIELVARIRYHSRAYMNQLQRDDAYRALYQSQRQLQETNIELQRLTNVDGLTGLSNRRYFDEFVDAQWKLAMREHKPISLLMVDVDDFKRYNDTYGHLAGDEVLKRLAALMSETFSRPTDLCARFGGEEFVVVLPSTPAAAARMLGQRLVERVRSLAIMHSGSTVNRYVTVSMGGATRIPNSAERFHAFMDTADQALYRAKNGGKDRVVMDEGGEEL